MVFEHQCHHQSFLSFSVPPTLAFLIPVSHTLNPPLCLSFLSPRSSSSAACDVTPQMPFTFRVLFLPLYSEWGAIQLTPPTPLCPPPPHTHTGSGRNWSSVPLGVNQTNWHTQIIQSVLYIKHLCPLDVYFLFQCNTSYHGKHLQMVRACPRWLF